MMDSFTCDHHNDQCQYVFLISCLCVREEIMVATEEGSLHRIKWNASVNQKASFHIRGFPASLDFHQTKGTETVKRWTVPLQVNK